VTQRSIRINVITWMFAIAVSTLLALLVADTFLGVDTRPLIDGLCSALAGLLALAGGHVIQCRRSEQHRKATVARRRRPKLPAVPTQSHLISRVSRKP